jgi:hypothetical protein
MNDAQHNKSDTNVVRERRYFGTEAMVRQIAVSAASEETNNRK